MPGQRPALALPRHDVLPGGLLLSRSVRRRIVLQQLGDDTALPSRKFLSVLEHVACGVHSIGMVSTQLVGAAAVRRGIILPIAQRRDALSSGSMVWHGFSQPNIVSRRALLPISVDIPLVLSDAELLRRQRVCANLVCPGAGVSAEFIHTDCMHTLHMSAGAHSVQRHRQHGMHAQRPV